MIKYLAASALALLIGCAAPQNKSGSVELSRDSRDYTSLNVYGKADLPIGNVFGQIELKSVPGDDASDLGTFNMRARNVRYIRDLGLAAEHRGSSGPNNDVDEIGIAYKPIKGVEARFYPATSDGSSQLGISFRGNLGEFHGWDFYFGGFADVKLDDGKTSGGGKASICAEKDDIGVFLEIRHFDSDRTIGRLGGAAGLRFGF